MEGMLAQVESVIREQWTSNDQSTKLLRAKSNIQITAKELRLHWHEVDCDWLGLDTTTRELNLACCRP